MNKIIIDKFIYYNKWNKLESSAFLGRNKYLRKSPKLYRGLISLFKVNICNYNFILKNKETFIKSLFSWFYKSTLVFNIDPVLKNKDKGIIMESDFINISASVKFIFLKKLFNILNFKLLDEKKIKKRKYTLLFTLFFSYNVNDILLDINSNETGLIYVFVNLNPNIYLKDIIQIIFYYYKNLVI
jgi:hypothetical protein